jgi:microcystin-dependent protein
MKTIKNIPLSNLTAAEAEQAYMLISGISDRADYSDKIAYAQLKAWITAQLGIRVTNLENIVNAPDVPDEPTGPTTGSGGEFTADDRSRLMPSGTIVMWSGSTPPPNWKLCDGSAGTPDLRGRFIIGADGGHPINTTGGGNAAAAGITIGAAGGHEHALAGAVGASVTGVSVSATSSKVDAGGSANNVPRLPFTMSDPGHTHDLAGVASAVGDHTHTASITDPNALVPAYYSLAYIMKA